MTDEVKSWETADGVDSTADAETMNASQIENIVKKYDAESNFRNLGGITAKITGFLCIALSLFHVYTAGFGLLNEVTHRTVHLTLVLGLVFLVFPRRTPKKLVNDWGFGLWQLLLEDSLFILLFSLNLFLSPTLDSQLFLTMSWDLLQLLW